jgi:hypothetical protein
MLLQPDAVFKRLTGGKPNYRSGKLCHGINRAININPAWVPTSPMDTVGRNAPNLLDPTGSAY